MSGPSAMGVYLPCRRPREVAGEARRFVAAGDEDVLTLAVEAAHRCLEQVEPLTFGGVFFASTTLPPAERQFASVLATVCDLPRDIVTADFVGSSRAGLSATVAAARAVASGVRRILVVAADCRRSGAESAGDGAVALVIDSRARLGRLLGTAAVSGDLSFQAPEGGALPEREREMAEVAERVLNEYGVGADQLAALALDDPGAVVGARVAEMIAADPATRIYCEREGGALGVAGVLRQLAHAFEEVSPGDRVVAVASGNGAEAVLFEAGDGVGEGACRPPVRRASSRRPGSMPTPAGAIDPMSATAAFGSGSVDAEPAAASAPASRDADVASRTRLYGTRCAACGSVHFPPGDRCASCGTHEGLERAKLVRRGRVLARVDAAGALVELDGGGRLHVALADVDAQDPAVGEDVVLTLRRALPGSDVRYDWKARVG